MALGTVLPPPWPLSSHAATAVATAPSFLAPRLTSTSHASILAYRAATCRGVSGTMGESLFACLHSTVVSRPAPMSSSSPAASADQEHTFSRQPLPERWMTMARPVMSLVLRPSSSSFAPLARLASSLSTLSLPKYAATHGSARPWSRFAPLSHSRRAPASSQAATTSASASEPSSHTACLTASTNASLALSAGPFIRARASALGSDMVNGAPGGGGRAAKGVSTRAGTRARARTTPAARNRLENTAHCRRIEPRARAVSARGMSSRAAARLPMRCAGAEQRVAPRRRVGPTSRSIAVRCALQAAHAAPPGNHADPHGVRSTHAAHPRSADAPWRTTPRCASSGRLTATRAEHARTRHHVSTAGFVRAQRRNVTRRRRVGPRRRKTHSATRPVCCA